VFRREPSLSRSGHASSGVGADQIDLIQRARAYLNQRRERGLDVAVDPECYMTAWANTRGNARLRRLAFGWRTEPARLLARAKDAAVMLRSPGFAVSAWPSTQSDLESLIVSWALPSDFDVHGAYTDRYLNLSTSDTPRALWLLLLMDGPVPARLPSNVRVLYRSASSPKSRMWHVSGVLSTHRISGVVAQANSIAAAVEDQLSCGRFRQVVMPYEGQPFQHAINLAAKAQDPDIVTVGYVHSALPALPTDFLFRPGAPDRLLVNGLGQAEILSQHLGWPTDRLKSIPSLRYLRDRATPLAGRIVMPYSFRDADAIANILETYMRSAPDASMPRWQVRNHPAMVSSSKHVALADRLQAIIERYASRTSSNESVSRHTLIIGGTASILESLERDLEVVHVCMEPLFEQHSAAIWTHIDVENLTSNVCRYRLRERGAYIQFGEAPKAGVRVLGLDIR
jgi:hypothetical protein